MATTGSEGRCSKSGEHNESEPILADNLGNLAKSGNAQYLDKIVCYNGCVSRQDSLLNKGSLYPCMMMLAGDKFDDKELANR